ncbi:MAG: hypothetical protein B6D39_03700 [Anaerolineae bacterium UTCFX2]|nr:hypothetical protein [Anaerolineae bacterium]OQY92999.1 MAG: hypothetical protein B6D39_03700 [Anaerolineae bacterium UTCFX2]
MSVRLFDCRDLPTLYRYRRKMVYLDSALLLTQGPLAFPGAIMSFLAPAMGVVTCVKDGKRSQHPPLLGQFIHLNGSPLSHLTFISPTETLEPERVCPLVEHLMFVSGERGALRLLADVEDGTPAFESLRKCSFVIYNRQRIWQLTTRRAGNSAIQNWRAVNSRDSLHVRNLYDSLVPGLVQQIEPFTSQKPRGMVYYQNGELLAYVELKYGRRGIWVQPFIHPDAQDVPHHFTEMIKKLPGRRNRPIYICIRSYQSWLEPAIEELGAEAGARQAVMARQLVVQQKAVRQFALPALEGGQPEITAPIARLERQ